MASISTATNGQRVIQFTGAAGKRYTIRLGKVSRRLAEEVKVKVEALAAAAAAGLSFDRETGQWVAGLPVAMVDKLAAVGLLPHRQAGASRLGAFLHDYIAKRTDLDPASACNLRIGAARLTRYFGAERELSTISSGDCDEWVVQLKAQYAPATVGRSVRWARQFFRVAVRKRLVQANPFEDVKGPGEKNDSRQRFINRDTAAAVLEMCPSLEWRLIFALSRFGGLRCPSEHMVLEWSDVDWDKGRLRIASSKTGERWIPLFPELRPYLEAAFDAAPEGATHILRRRRDAAKEFRTGLLRILRKAGITPWPRLYHNLRATRETELAAEHPLHVVCSWIGNSERIAARHYLQLTDADFDKANSGSALQNPTQQPAVPARTESQRPRTGTADVASVQEDANRCEPTRNAPVVLCGSGHSTLPSIAKPQVGFNMVSPNSFREISEAGSQNQ